MWPYFIYDLIDDYELEETDFVWILQKDIDSAYKIIHSKSYSDVLISVAKNYVNTWYIIIINLILN